MIIGATARNKLAATSSVALAAVLVLAACDNQTSKPAPAATPAPAASAAAPAPTAPSAGPAIPVPATDMIKEQGYAWVVQTKINPAERKLHVYEDGKELGPGDSMHEDVRKKGLGAYSHWDAAEWGYRVYFSTSDNSDPTKNGRTYELR